MSKQIINIGNSPNDGAGDPARSAFNKVNSNFSELYSKMGDGSSLFSPVQQGGGTGQGNNKIYLGWSGSSLKAQVDSTDLGNVQTSSSNMMLAVNQSWVSVTQSRSIGTTYTNSTNKPILISIILSSVSSGTQVIWYVNDVAINASTLNMAITQLPIMFVVPPGQTYKLTSSSGSIGSWMELR